MPKVKWKDLPPQLRQHLFDRAKECKISMDDLFAPEEWRMHSPDVPEGPWYKDFGSFKLCGEGQYPKTFLLRVSPRMARKSSRGSDSAQQQRRSVAQRTADGRAGEHVAEEVHAQQKAGERDAERAEQ